MNRLNKHEWASVYFALNLYRNRERSRFKWLRLFGTDDEIKGNIKDVEYFNELVEKARKNAFGKEVKQK